MPRVLVYEDGPQDVTHDLNSSQCSEIYNALCDRANELRKIVTLPDVEDPSAKLNGGITPRMRQSFEESLKTCEKLIEVFE